MIDDKSLDVVLRDGQLVVAMVDDVLFDSGLARLKPKGTEALVAVASALQQLPDRSFRVVGHTDSAQLLPSAKFKDNWEMSQARAYTVLKFLIEQKVDPKRLTTGAHSEFEPVATDETPEGRAKNRRTELLVPNLDELVPEIEHMDSVK